MSDPDQNPENPLHQRIPEIIEKRLFALPDDNVWCPSPIRSADGHYHLFFSRWPKAKGHEAWVTHSRICRAESDSPLGPWKVCGEIFEPGDRDNMWDQDVGHNGHVVEVAGKYFLYYTGNHGSGYWHSHKELPRMTHPEWWVNRNQQRVGVATAPHPRGPWTRMDAPLLEPPSGYRLTATPYFMSRPDGKCQLVFKAVKDGGGERGSEVRHFIALSDHPLGPFRVIDEPMLSGTRTEFPIDDHCQWFQDGRFWCLAKDHGEGFAGITPCLLLLESSDGLQWRPYRPYFTLPFHLTWSDGSSNHFNRLEMPKFLFNGGVPEVLYLAAKPAGSESSYCVIIPLKDLNSDSANLTQNLGAMS
jgi:hypothetical protein